MRKISVILFLCCLFSLLYAQDTIRIMTLNINQGSDTSLQAIGEIIKFYKPDLVALQEVDLWPNRSYAQHQKNKNFIAELGYYTDMLGYFGKAYDHPGGWDYGDGILSKYPATKVESTILSHIGKVEPRQLIWAHINIKGHNICFASTHFSYENKNNRELQIKKVKSIMRKQKEKIQFVCGDFNSDYKEDLILKVMKQWADALPNGEATFSSYSPAKYKYDYILYNKNAKVKVVNSEIICNGSISDHCTCITDIIIY